MRRVVDLGQRLEVEVGVHLRGGDAGVAEQLLHRAQVLRGLQHVRGERVAQHVRMHVLGEAAAARPGAEAGRHRARRDAPAARADEQRLLFGRRELGAHLRPSLQRRARLGADGDGARLRSLAGDGHFALRGIVGEVQRHQLAHAQAGGIQQLEHRCIPEVSNARFPGRIQQSLRRLHGKRLGKRPRRLRRADAEHRIRSPALVPRQPAEPSAPGRQRERERARREALGVQHGDVAAHLRRLQALQLLLALQLEQQVDGVRVVTERGSRQPALVLQRVQVLSR